MGEEKARAEKQKESEEAEMRDKLMLEYPEKMCEYCCNFDKEHIGMDGTALCKLTMTLAYAEDYGGNCMFYNVPKEQIIVPPCKVGDTIYFVSRGEIIPMVVNCISFNGNYQYCLNCNYADEEQYGYSLLTFTDKVRGYMFGFTREEAEKALAERSGE